MVTQDTETTMEIIMKMTMEMITGMSITTMKMMDTTRTKLTFENFIL